MKQIRNLIVVVSALVLVLLDVSFFVSIEVYGATILSALSVLLIMAMIDKTKSYYVFSLSLVLFYSIFTSLPLGIIIINFFVLPAMLNLVRVRFFPEPTTITAFFYLLGANLFFESVLMVYSGELNESGWLAFSYFVFLNTVFGLLLFYLYSLAKKRLLRDEIKL
jgi:hypothetical protein